MIGATFCSGIGAPEVAAPWVDWRLASEIEPFPRAVLQECFGYRLPEDHNQGDPLLWGDMTEVTPDLLRSRGIPLPDLIVAGTPCQDFSVAGLRAGLSGDRGNLTLSFVEICHAIVDARPDGKLAVLWENVPGVLSDNGNAFGCFLGGLVGAMDALPPPANGSWPGEGMVQGPRARAAWAVLDAQWFGVAQRRRRVFVVVDFGNCVDPAAVLHEPDRLRGDSPPRREAGERPAATITGSLGGCSGKDDPGGRLISSTGNVAHCLNAGGMGRQDYETETMIAHTLKAEGFDAPEDGTGRGTPIVPVAWSIMPQNSGSDYKARQVDVAQPLMASGPVGGNQGGDYITHPVAFDCKGTEVQYSTDGSSPTLRSMGHSNSHQNAGGHAAVAIQERAVSENPNAGPQGKGWQEGVGYTLEARQHVQAVAFDMRGHAAEAEPFVMMERGRADGRSLEYRQDGTANAILTPNGGRGGFGIGAIAAPWAVRRLMPVECARLQGFPDDHTAITYRGKPAADGPQYKAYGNSMCVNVMAWILSRMKISMEDHGHG